MKKGCKSGEKGWERGAEKRRKWSEKDKVKEGKRKKFVLRGDERLGE
jgi:hypothetical protein